MPVESTLLSTPTANPPMQEPPQPSPEKPSLTRTVALSYAALAVALVVIGWLHLATMLVTILFSIFALRNLCFNGRKWLAVLLFIVVVIAASFGFGFFVRNAAKQLPIIAADVIPRVVEYALQKGIVLNFSDLDDLKAAAPELVRQSPAYVGNVAKLATKELVMLVAGVVIAIGMFLNPQHQKPGTRESLYTFYYNLISQRFQSLYTSFETVMGAQLLISSINTVATAVFLLSTSFPYASVVIPLTFFCGLLPIVGNLISNALIVGIALARVSPQMALWSLLFLVTIHKAEYFLNSKIIGSRIEHPMWMTLIALILGEYLIGIPGVILAPVILNFIKVESSRFAPPVLSDHKPSPL